MTLPSPPSLDLSILATSDLAIVTDAGNAEGTLTASDRGVGIAIALNAVDNQTEAWIGQRVQADAAGTMEILAEATVTLDTSALGGAGAAEGLAASVALNGLIATTQAFAASGSAINQAGSLADPAQSVRIRASDQTDVSSQVGMNSVFEILGGGAGIDAGALVKKTQAFIGGTADAERDIAIEAVSREAVRSISTASVQALETAIAGSGGVYVLDITTRAFVDAGAVIRAEGNVLVSANDATEVDISAGTTSTADEVGESASVGAALAVPIIDKATEAFVAGADVVRGLRRERDRGRKCARHRRPRRRFHDRRRSRFQRARRGRRARSRPGLDSQCRLRLRADRPHGSRSGAGRSVPHKATHRHAGDHGRFRGSPSRRSPRTISRPSAPALAAQWKGRRSFPARRA